jgi:hypothetical protein
MRTVKLTWLAPIYIGDIFGSLGGTPDFGPGPTPEVAKRSITMRKRSKRYLTFE